jgi:hypothetical protein
VPANGERRVATSERPAEAPGRVQMMGRLSQLLSNKVFLVLSGCLRQQQLTVGIYADMFNVHKVITSETAIKLMHEEIEILSRHGTDKNVCITRN